MRFLLSFVTALACIASSSTCAAAASALTVNDAGDAGDGTCTSVCTLRDAIGNVASGGSIDFAPELLPATITLTKGPLIIVKQLTIQGPGAELLSISANSASRVLSVASFPESVNISGVTLRDGRVVGVAGGNGGKETGSNGVPGVTVLGGCILATNSSLHLENTDVRNCVAQGGNGGRGGSGIPHAGLGGPGGAGGAGGFAYGGAIGFQTSSPNIYSLVLRNSSVTDSQAIGGAGGAGGAGGSGSFVGPGGSGAAGGTALGGAIAWFVSDAFSATVFLYSSSVADSAAIGGSGGNGGAPGGDGGNGGPALGGLVSLDSNFAINFGTLANGSTQGGAGGSGSTPGSEGSALGAAIHQNKALPAATVAVSTVIVGNGPAPLCWKNLYTSSGHNLDQDDTCGFDMHGSLALFRPLDPDAARPHYLPVYRSAVIDAAASCNDLSIPPVDVDDDQLGTARPQGSACDLGAIEADYVFVDGFD